MVLAYSATAFEPAGGLPGGSLSDFAEPAIFSKQLACFVYT